MSQFSAVLASSIIMLSATAASAAPVLPGKGPFTFTGSVTTATKACPYAAKTKLSGFIYSSGFQQFTVPGGPLIASPGFKMVITPADKAGKEGLEIGGFSFFAHSAANVNGSLKVLALPSTAQANGTYALKLTFNSKTEFAGVLGVKFGQCTASYSLDFKKGIPANLLNLL